ncbi:MAG: hypothetical protein MZV49_20980 [Rhodopseudomonas palustris]|nr:hypothetical protein [Rhodopseudomonas palustris]
MGTATIAAFIGAGGFGERIVTGLALNDHITLLAGAIPAAALALVVEALFGWGQRPLDSARLARRVFRLVRPRCSTPAVDHQMEGSAFPKSLASPRSSISITLAEPHPRNAAVALTQPRAHHCASRAHGGWNRGDHAPASNGSP